jgi:serine protease AprX
MKGILKIVMLLLSSAGSAQQIAENVYWIYFTDKHSNGYEFSQPGSFLSERSINRRAWQGLGVDLTDEPVTQAYVDELKNMGVEVRHVSKWLNGLAMVNASRQLYEQVLEKPFVDSVPWDPGAGEAYFPPAPAGERFSPPLSSPPGFDYGIAREQVRMMDTDLLHEKGYTGSGVWIGVLDAGFRNVDSLPSFESMISEGRLLGTRNFVSDSSLFRVVGNHGMFVLSIIGAEWDGQMMGTAPHASFFLCMTENIHQETRIEEIAWIEAAEYLDSLGCDVFNTSLGYSDFDGTGFDYTYKDMDGRTTFISRAASMTSAKGIVACVSAGNEGNRPWRYISAPSDAFDILGVGAVDSTFQVCDFSSRGPSYDGRVKPDLMAMGRAAGFQYLHGWLARGNGTSFSSPLMAGSVASLWQAFPELPATELMHIVRQTGDRFGSPDPDYGYGMPSFSKAYLMIRSMQARPGSGRMEIFPNPAGREVTILLPGEDTGEYLLHYYDMSGRRVTSQQVSLPGMVSLPAGLEGGAFILEIRTSQDVYRNILIIK